MPLIAETGTSSVADYLEASAVRFPQRPAVVNPDGTALNYRELDNRSERVAAFLSARGVNAGDRIAIWMPKSVNTLVAIFGILKARAAYVPNRLDGPGGKSANHPAGLPHQGRVRRPALRSRLERDAAAPGKRHSCR